ncbi:WhiB family transcriptional regulator [Rhodococcus sp. NPDC057529]|uniref:WhiB family transcriptional regulator n=1 Tax=Rhodococcus sp. NPDC057529 TaxID=3346158 RepID=UPI00366BD1BE
MTDTGMSVQASREASSPRLPDPARTDHLPDPVAAGGLLTATWAERAACRNVTRAVFFSPDGERGGDRTRREAEAKRICADCPVLGQCRDYALAAAEPYGTWGGMSETDRRKHHRRQRRTTNTLDAPPPHRMSSRS